MNGFQKKSQKTPRREIELAKKLKKNITMKNETNIIDIDQMMDEKFGAVGSKERDEFRKEAYNYCVGQLILEARKQEKMTQSVLAEKVGTTKSHLKSGKGIFRTWCWNVSSYD